MVRWKEVLEGLDVAIGGIVVATGVVILGPEARFPGTIVEVVTRTNVRRECQQIEITDLASLKGKFALVFPAMKLFRITFESRTQSDEISACARS